MAARPDRRGDGALPRALKIKPDYAEAQINLASPWRGADGWTRRWRIIEKALEIKPDYAEAHINLGIVLASRGRIDEAIARFRKTLETGPDDAEAHYASASPWRDATV